jgi:CubicO group peptidase (beta-lactamase class C family)
MRGTKILDPLGMVDTAFAVAEKKQDRLVAYYLGADLMNPMKPGLTRSDNAPYPGAYLRPVPRLSGGGGMVSTLPDMVALIRSLLPGGPTLLKPDTIALMMSNRLPEGMWMRFPNTGVLQGRRTLLGRPSGHAMVDLAKGRRRGRDDGAASHGIFSSLCVSVQAAGI